MTTIDADRLAWLDALHLGRGQHGSPDQGACAVEAAAFLAKESFTDHPECTSPVIGAFMRALNDQWDDERRQTLKRHIPALIGTNTGKADDEARAWMATDWLVRVHTPAFLRLAGLNEHADNLASLAPLDGVTTPKLLPVIKAAQTDARAAWAAAGDAAWAAAWDAAWAAAGAAARNAARNGAGAAARNAAGAAAWDAAWDAAGAAAGDAAGDAAWAAAGAAAGDAAGAAAWAAAWDAAGAAAWAALAPTVEALQPSIHDLIERMCAVGRVEAAA